MTSLLQNFFTPRNNYEVVNTEEDYGPDTERVLQILKDYKQKYNKWNFNSYVYKSLIFENLNITHLPPLPNDVTHLYIRNTNIIRISEIPNTVIALSIVENKKLYIINKLPNDLDYLKLLGNKKLGIIPPLPSKLKIFYLWRSPYLESLHSFPESVKNINLGDNNFVELPPLPKNLEVLSCLNNNLSKLPHLPSSLVELYCNSNNLTNMPELPPNLKVLYCSDNLFSEFPPLPQTLIRFECKGCPNLVIQKRNEETIQDYEARLSVLRKQHLLQKEKDILKDMTIHKTKMLKEELMIKTWHPNRMIKWCIDEQEKKDFQEEDIVFYHTLSR